MRKVTTTRKAFDLIMGIQLQDLLLLFSYGVDAQSDLEPRLVQQLD